MKGYAQFCPIAKAAEVFAERWTPLVIRNLLLGADTFSEILAGVPRMSRTLLAERLRTLERNGILSRSPAPTGRGSRYHLTEAGRELADVCIALGSWGARWLPVTAADSDPYVVLWAWQRFMDRERLPDQRVVVRFTLTDHPDERFWLHLDREGAELSIKAPSVPEDVIVTTDSETLVRVHMGRLELAEAQRLGLWRTEGEPDLAVAFPTWGGISPYKNVEPARAS